MATSKLMRYLGKKLDDAWFTAMCVIYVLWWPMLGLAAVIALCVIAASLASGCTPEPTNASCAKVCKGALKKVAESNLKDCMVAVKGAISKVKAVYETNGQACDCIKVSPKTGPLTVLSFKVEPIECFCYSTKYRHDDIRCRMPHCSAVMPTKVKVENGTAKAGDQLHVECIYYDMRDTDRYLIRDQEFFKAAPGKFTTHAFKAALPHHTVRYLPKGTVIGVECSVVDHPRPPVNAVAKTPAKVDKKYDK